MTAYFKANVWGRSKGMVAFQNPEDTPGKHGCLASVRSQLPPQGCVVVPCQGLPAWSAIRAPRANSPSPNGTRNVQARTLGADHA